MSLLPENTPIVEVTKEDQQMISAFSRHHMKYENRQKLLQAVVKQLDELESASTGFMDHDGNAMIQIGNGYFADDSMELISYVETMTEDLEKQRAALEQEIADIHKTLEKLKVVLVGKFGNSINLNYEQK